MKTSQNDRYIMQYIKADDETGRKAIVGVLVSGVNKDGKIAYGYSLANTNPSTSQKASGVTPDRYDMRKGLGLSMKRLNDGGVDITKLPSMVSAVMKTKRVQMKTTDFTSVGKPIPANFVVCKTNPKRGYLLVRGFKDRSEAYFKGVK